MKELPNQGNKLTIFGGHHHFRSASKSKSSDTLYSLMINSKGGEMYQYLDHLTDESLGRFTALNTLKNRGQLNRWQVLDSCRKRKWKKANEFMILPRSTTVKFSNDSPCLIKRALFQFEIEGDEESLDSDEEALLNQVHEILKLNDEKKFRNL
eukprot:CAMPEP_0182443666 /NCGR_PEP_ID=MMETSP1172-20130603/2347_1 /TAXON_ID=708627 /ORGANISM="Timspurckia oligopyrenoides, Strain CCMP3278" /LENGTH=152 /DNA_ID=CAMNT_0024639019 /DNA_START=63 /DNA_END=521 /DNA_ORIENTATION=-